jgi:hypothetical protein
MPGRRVRGAMAAPPCASGAAPSARDPTCDAGRSQLNPIAQLFALPALNRLAGAYAPASKVTRYTRAGLPGCRPPLRVNR